MPRSIKKEVFVETLKNFEVSKDFEDFLMKNFKDSGDYLRLDSYWRKQSESQEVLAIAHLFDIKRS